MQRAKSIETRQTIAFDWFANWQEDHDRTIRDLERAVNSGDFDAQCRTTGQLKALHEKRFSGVRNVIAGLVRRDEIPEEPKDN